MASDRKKEKEKKGEGEKKGEEKGKHNPWRIREDP